MGEVRRISQWVPVSETLLRHSRGQFTEAEITADWQRRQQRAAYTAAMLDWHRQAVVHAAGLVRDVVTRHRPVATRWGLDCLSCSELTGEHSEEWPCREYRAAAVYIDYTEAPS